MEIANIISLTTLTSVQEQYGPRVWPIVPQMTNRYIHNQELNYLVNMDFSRKEDLHRTLIANGH